jgi:hypothetical protein
MLVATLRASDDATAGSVVANADRISPSNRDAASAFAVRAAEVGQQFDVARVGGRAVQRSRRDVWALVVGWTFFSAFWRRVAPADELDPNAHGYIGEKFNPRQKDQAPHHVGAVAAQHRFTRTQ